MRYTLILILAVILLVPATGMADNGFDYTKCSTIRDVNVPYEIELGDDIQFMLNGQHPLSITATDQVLDAQGKPYAISPELEARLAAAVREFVKIGTDFGRHFGGSWDWSERMLDDAENISEGLLELFSASCRNLFELKSVQQRIVELDPEFSPIVFVQGFGEQS